MEGLVKGDVVIVPFPFSDLTKAKRRPAFVLAPLRGDDVVLCQITSQDTRDEHAVPITDGDFAEGSLDRPSNVRPDRVFTADSGIVIRKVGRVNPLKTEQVIKRLVEILNR